MKQATVKLPSGEHRFLSELPDGTVSISQVHIYAGENPIVFHDKDGAIISSISIPGWQLLGADPTALTEEEAGDIVEQVTIEIDVPLRSGGPLRYGMFKNYTTDDQFNFACPVASLSLDSLASSLGISKPYVVLKNIEK